MTEEHARLFSSITLAGKSARESERSNHFRDTQDIEQRIRLGLRWQAGSNKWIRNNGTRLVEN